MTALTAENVHQITDAPEQRFVPGADQYSMEKLPVTHVFIATPCYGGQLTEAFFQSSLNLNNWLRGRPDIKVTWYTIAGESLITRARNDAVKKFMETDAEVLLFIDADIEFLPVHFERLVDSDYPVSAQVYPLKTMNFDNMIARGAKDKPSFIASGLSVVINAVESENDENGFRPCLDAGTGFMAIKRHVIEEMMEAHPELRYVRDEIDSDANDVSYALFDTVIDNGRYLSEDYTFCRRWQNMGGQVMVDLSSPILIHFGFFKYGKV